MGRRKKEPPSVHREAIATAAAELFHEKGIQQTSMDDVARAAGYSKATLYVYFQNKEEIVGLLAMKSMQTLEMYLTQAIESAEGTRIRYDRICQGLVRYQEEYPLYFEMVQNRIAFDEEREEILEDERTTYLAGEQINEKLISFFRQGIEKGDLKKDLEIPPTILSFWGMLAGLIRLASCKAEYVEYSMGIKKDDFLQKGFDLLYDSISC